jgi:hypothetical protein
VGAFSLTLIAGIFQQLGYLAAVIAFIFVYRHQNFVSIVNFVRNGIYVMITRCKYQHQFVFSSEGVID